MTSRRPRRVSGLARTAALVCATAALAAVAASATGCAVSRAADAPPKAAWRQSLRDDFQRSEILTETTAPDTSSSATWWLDSGAMLTVQDGTAATLRGDAPDGYLRRRYAQRSPRDTDGGRHPQNLFRLLTRTTWSGPVAPRCDFRVLDYNVSPSPERGVANGLLLFSRYADADNLYYAGVRVDGHAIVKKKSQGVYYTLGEKPLFDGEYQRDSAPTLLPRNRWVTVRSEVTDRADGSVLLALYVTEEGHPERLVLEAMDAGVGGAPFRSGRCGMRTDFMDVEFREFSVSVAR